MDPIGVFRRFMAGAAGNAHRLVSSSLTRLGVATPRESAGSAQNMMHGVPAGGVAWPIDPTLHDGASFVAADIFLAEYDSQANECVLLDDLSGTAHFGQKPLKVGKNLTLSGAVTGRAKGFVIRTAEYGDKGLDKNIFIPMPGNLFAHHEGQNPGTLSSLVSDLLRLPPGIAPPPGTAPQTRAGPLHYPWRVRLFTGQLRFTNFSGVTFPTALLFNFGLNGDNTPAFGAAYFSRRFLSILGSQEITALLSGQANGPLSPADDGWHTVGANQEGEVVPGGLWIDSTLFGGLIPFDPLGKGQPGNPLGYPLFSPAEWRQLIHPGGYQGGFYWQEVVWTEDISPNTGSHFQAIPQQGQTPAQVAQRPGLKRWLTKSFDKMYPPWIVPVKPGEKPFARFGQPPGGFPPGGLPPGGGGPGPGPGAGGGGGGGGGGNGGGGNGGGPGPGEPIIPGPVPGADGPTLPMGGTGTVATPMPREGTRQFTHPMPDAPDGPAPLDVPTAKDAGKDALDFEKEWRKLVGWTEKQWSKVPLVHVRGGQPVYQSESRNQKGDPWPAQKSENETLFEQGGNIVGRKPATGPGNVHDMPPQLSDWHILYEQWSHDWARLSPSALAVIVMAGKAANGQEVIGRSGHGVRHLLSPYIARGWEWKMTYAGNGGVVSPDYHLTSKDEDAAEDPASGAVFRVNNVRVGARVQKNYSLTANVADLDVSDLFPWGTYRVTSDDAANELRGILAPSFTGWPSEETPTVRLTCVGANGFVIINNSGDASAGNKIIVPGGDLTVAQHDSVDFEYDRTDAVWRVV